MKLSNHPFSPANFRCGGLLAATSPHSRLAGRVHPRLAPDERSKRASRISPHIWGVHAPIEPGTPDGTDGWWEVTDPQSAGDAVNDIVEQLARAGWPVLEGLLERNGILAQIRRGDLGDMNRSSFGVFFARAEALLLMGRGPSLELAELLDYAIRHVMPTQKADAERFDSWVRAQADLTR